MDHLRRLVSERTVQRDWRKARLLLMFALGETRDPKRLQEIFLNELPYIPLFIGPRWSTYSTKYFHCFNSPKNFYGDPIFTTAPDNILSFTTICPGGKAGA